MVYFQLRQATTFSERLRGLIGRRLRSGEGLLFKNSSGLHTYFMTYNLDILFLDKTGHILKIIKNLPPWRFSYCKNADHFIEFPSDHNNSIIIGQFIDLTHF